MKGLLLTGANGYIGRNLLKDVSPEFAVVRSKCDIVEQLSFSTRMFQTPSIDESTNWESVFGEVDVDTVIHLAALAHNLSYTKQDFEKVNVYGTLNLAKQAASFGVKKFIFVSSIGVNGRSTSNKPFSHLDEPFCHNDYALSKYNAEIALRQVAYEAGMEVVIVRPTLVYGANAPGNFGLLTKLVQKLPLLPFGLVDNKRDFISVKNLADLLVTCTIHPNAGGHTFLASEMETVSIKEFTNAIAKGLGKKVIQLPIPVSLMRLVGKLVGKSEMVEQLVGNLQVDSSNLAEVLGWKPPYTMEESMASLSTMNHKGENR